MYISMIFQKPLTGFSIYLSIFCDYRVCYSRIYHIFFLFLRSLNSFVCIFVLRPLLFTSTKYPLHNEASPVQLSSSGVVTLASPLGSPDIYYNSAPKMSLEIVLSPGSESKGRQWP